MSEKANSYQKYLLPVILSIVFLSTGFGLGVVYQKNKLKTTFTNRMGQFQTGEGIGRSTGRNQNGQGNGMGLRNGAGSGATFGEVTKIDDASITLKTIDGGSKIILISDSTIFNKSTSVSKTELKVGSQVRVDGTTDTNTGSVTGKSIEIDPARNGQTTPVPQQ